MTIALLPAFGISWLLGYLTVRFFLIPQEPRWADLLLRISLGAGVGIGISGSLYFLIWLVRPSTTALVVAELAAAVGLWAAARRSRRSPAALRPAGTTAAAQRGFAGTWVLVAAVLLGLALAASAFVDASRAKPHGEWDAWAIWNLRAKFLVEHDASWKGAFSPLLIRTHSDYPLLTSAYVARCWNYMGATVSTLAPIGLAGLFALCTFGLVVSALAVLRGPASGLLGALLLLGSPVFLWQSAWQYADIPVGFFFLSALVVLLLAGALPEHEPKLLALAGIAASFAAWTKNEGLLFLPAVACCFGAIALRFSIRRIGYFLAGAAPVLLVTLYFKLALAPAIDPLLAQGAASAGHKLAQFSRYSRIVSAFGTELVSFGPGIANPLVTLVVLALCLKPRFGGRLRGWLVSAGLTLAVVFMGYFFVYVMTPSDLAWHLSSSLNRLLVQLWPSFVFFCLAALHSPEETAIMERTKSEAPREKQRKKAARG